MNQRTMAIGLGVLLLVLGLSFFLIYELKEEPRVGGPCSYGITNYPAEITSIDTLGQDLFSLNLIVTFGEFKDTMFYKIDSTLYSDLSPESKSLIVKGQHLTYQDHYIIDGSCNPNYYTLKFEKYIREE